MEDIWLRFVENLGDRISGPMSLRLVLQPAIAGTLAIVAGLRDAKLGKAPYFWSLLTDPAHQGEMLRDGWKSVGKVFVVAMLLDVVYQLIATRFVYPGEVVIVALLLAIVPYLILRGLATHLAQPRPV